MLLPELAPDLLPPEAAEWRKAFGALRPTFSPCSYLGATAWANIYEAYTDFTKRFGAEAVTPGVDRAADLRRPPPARHAAHRLVRGDDHRWA